MFYSSAAQRQQSCLSEQLKYLGQHLDAWTMNVLLSEERMTALLRLAHRVETATTVRPGRFMLLLGMMSAGHHVVRLGFLHMGNI